jgi:diaminohydroxyphosphoribosylaminopyrimidine deaminase/5-amino-6-(5-phosphoribosylamino)uracil reductase
VRDGRILAEGFHESFGGPHAEVNAIAAAEAAGIDPTGATMYVTLEPCSHHGKTPPCADLLADKGLARVVVALADPDENVNGGGIRRLRAGGIDVAVGCCGDQARALLREYLTLRMRRRPWVIAKWAQTRDGWLALPDGAGRWISSQASRDEVHQLRAVCDGICVGIGTVQADDPLLTNRSGSGRDLTRLVLDANLRISPASRLVTSAEDSPLLIATTAQAIRRRDAHAEALAAAGAELLALPAEDGRIDLEPLLADLGRRMWTRLLVEGGSGVLRSFLGAGLVDEIRVYVAPCSAGDETRAAALPRLDVADLNLPRATRRAVGPDTVIEAVLADASEKKT